MAHEITSTDGLVLNATPAWHGLGTVLPEAPSVGQAIREAGLDWTVEQVPLILGEDLDGLDPEGEPCTVLRPQLDTDAADGSLRRVHSHVANVRSDTGHVLGIVGKGYVPAQNVDVGGLVIDAAGTQGVRIESAGSLRGGREVFFCAQLGTFEALRGDVNHAYALFHNGHDGTASLSVAPTNTRVVCKNTQRMATETAKRNGLHLKLHFRHTKNLGDHLQGIREILSARAEVVQAAAAEAQALASRELTDDELREFFLRAYDQVQGTPRAPLPTGVRATDDKARAAFERKMQRMHETVTGWLGTLHSERETFNSAPSAWLAYNAVSKWSDHDRRVRGDRVHSNLFGASATAKGKVYEQAMALVG